jgi:capsular polysaccharide biosynthesis protein
MEFWTGVGIIVRRWYVVLVGVVVTWLIGALLVSSVSSRYDVTGSIVLMRLSPVPGEAYNPWQSADYSASQFALLMTEVMTGPEFKDSLERNGVSRDYAITNATNQTPVLTVVVHGETPDAANAAYVKLVDALRSEIRERQAAVRASEETWYSAVELATPSAPKKSQGSRIMVAVVIGILGLSVSVGVAFGLEAMANARRRRSQAPGAGTDLDVRGADAGAGGSAAGYGARGGDGPAGNGHPLPSPSTSR